MEVRAGDAVLLKRYPKGRKFEPIYEDEAYEVVAVEEKGVTVRDDAGRLKRRHKDDVKHFYGVTQLDEELPPEAEDEEVTVGDDEEVVSLAGAGAALEEIVPAPDTTPAGRPQRQRFTPGYLKDYVLRRIGVMRGVEC